MDLKIASAENSDELVAFFKEFPLRGLVDLKVDRSQDFFANYRIQSDSFTTYLLRDLENKLQTVGTIMIRQAHLDGQVIHVASAADLRVRNNRQAILQWANHVLPVLSKETLEHNANSIFSSISLLDPWAMNTFVRPRTMKRIMPRYYLYRRFHLVSLHGRFPWAKKPLSSIQIRQGSPANADALLAYIIRRSQYRPFASIWDTQSFERKLQRLAGQKLSDFFLAMDSDDNVLGCLAPWSAAGIQDFIPLTYSLQGHNFRQFLKFLWMFRLTRRLAKPVTSTGAENKLQFRYLTNVFADNEDVFESLLYAAFESVTANEFLVYAHTAQDYRLLPPLSWISASLPYALYSVTPPEKEMPTFLHPSIGLNPEIEAYSVL